jgi:hypothetical protein
MSKKKKDPLTFSLTDSVFNTFATDAFRDAPVGTIVFDDSGYNDYYNDDYVDEIVSTSIKDATSELNDLKRDLAKEQSRKLVLTRNDSEIIDDEPRPKRLRFDLNSQTSDVKPAKTVGSLTLPPTPLKLPTLTPPSLHEMLEAADGTIRAKSAMGVVPGSLVGGSQGSSGAIFSHPKPVFDTSLPRSLESALEKVIQDQPEITRPILYAHHQIMVMMLNDATPFNVNDFMLWGAARFGRVAKDVDDIKMIATAIASLNVSEVMDSALKSTTTSKPKKWFGSVMATKPDLDLVEKQLKYLLEKLSEIGASARGLKEQVFETDCLVMIGLVALKTLEIYHENSSDDIRNVIANKTNITRQVTRQIEFNILQVKNMVDQVDTFIRDTEQLLYVTLPATKAASS